MSVDKCLDLVGGRRDYQPIKDTEHDEQQHVKETRDRKMSKRSSTSQQSLEHIELTGERAFDESEVFARIPFFDDLDLHSLKKFKNSFKRQVYEPNEVVVSEGKRCEGFHILVKGQVALRVESKDGKELDLSIRRQGEYFGELALISESHIEPVTVRAIEQSILLSISAEDFRALVKEDDRIRVNVEDHAKAIRFRLSQVPFFEGIDELKLQQLATLFEIKQCLEGETICRQGDKGTGFYFIVKGRITVSAAGPLGGVHLNTLKEGDWFGEIALVQDTTRTADLVSIQPCTLLYLSKERFHTFMKIAPEMRESGIFDSTISRRTANSLKAVPLFGFLQKKKVGPLELFDESKLQLLGELFKFQQFDAGVTIFTEGEQANAFYLIIRGTCEVKTGGGLSDGKEVEPSILNVLTDNDWFGEIALTKGTVRTATVVTKTKCVLLKLEGDDFQKFLTICPDVKDTMEQIITVRTSKTLSRIPIFKTVKENKPWSKLAILGAMFQFEYLKEGDYVFREGDENDKFYVLVDGQAESSVAVYPIQGVSVPDISENDFLSDKKDKKDSKDGPRRVTLELLTKDSWFGGIGISKDIYRSKSVQCTEDCLLLTITKQQFRKFVKLAPEVTEQLNTLLNNRIANMLRAFDFFHYNIKETKPWNKLEMFSSMLELFKFEAKEVITTIRGNHLDDVSNQFYIVLLGDIEVTSSAKEGFKRELKKSSFFGEFTADNKIPSPLVFTAQGKTTVATLSKENFSKFLEIAPEFRVGLDKVYSFYPKEESWSSIS